MSRTSGCRGLAVLVTSTLLVLVAGAWGAARASADTRIVGLHGWQVQSSASVRQGGAQVSTPGFGASSWLQVMPDDAGAVGTEVGALVQTGHCPDVFFSNNMQNCFGYMNA